MGRQKPAGTTALTNAAGTRAGPPFGRKVQGARAAGGTVRPADGTPGDALRSLDAPLDPVIDPAEAVINGLAAAICPGSLARAYRFMQAVEAGVIGFRFATEDYQALLDQPLDAVVIASPHHLHYEQAKAALERGLHVMVEKPMALQAQQAWELVALARDRQRHLLVPYGWNYKPFVEEAQRQLAQQVIGRIEYVMCHMASPIRGLLMGSDVSDVAGDEGLFPPAASTWADPRLAGGGYGHSQLTHALGLLFFLTPLRAESVYAEMSAPQSRVELYDALTIRFQGGAIGVLSGAASVPPHNRFQLDVRLFGSEGMLLLDVERERMEVRRRNGRDYSLPVPGGQGDYSCEGPPQRFIELIRGLSTHNQSSGEMAARSVEVLDAAYRSAQSGRPEHLSRS